MLVNVVVKWSMLCHLADEHNLFFTTAALETVLTDFFASQKVALFATAKRVCAFTFVLVVVWCSSLT